MRIKSLQAHGFKSFADGIRLEVHEGVTSIVGPNGCGKSNIVDSLRWVMGELSAKHLRGTQMEDVIFGGSEYRKPMGRAEVKITLTDVAETVPEPYNQFTELEVVRRLYRTGESEYVINNVPARRRDVAELFLESGVGTRTISIIEQGQVTQVIKARPNERRFFIEQAAGILKYKSRRDSAVRKLEATKQNLQRVKDVLGELTRQRAMLERQAERAQRYQEIVVALREAELAWASSRFLELENRRKLVAEDAARLGAEKEAHAARLASLDAQIAQAKLERADRERQLTEAQQAVISVNEKIGKSETVREVAGEGIRLHGENARQAHDEASALAGREQRLEEERAQTAAQREELEQRLGTLSEKLAAEKQRVEAETENAARDEAAREAARSELMGLVSQAEQVAARLAFSEKSREEAVRRLGKLEAELNEVASQMAELSQTSFGFAEGLKSSRESLEQLRRNLSGSEQRLQAARGDLNTTQAELRAAKENLSEKATRLSSLREIERRYEGYGEGVQAIMLEAERRLAEEGRNGIYGLVADVVKTRPEYERAVESLLGERLQYVVVKSQNVGIEAVEFLKNESKGRGSFVPLTLRTEPAAPAALQADGVVGALREVVEVKEGYEAVADYLLRDAILVDRLDRAVGMWDAPDGASRTLVTLDGDVVDASGVITGGAGTGSGFLQKKREIGELESAVEEASEAVRELEARLSREQAQVAALESEVEEFKVRVHRIEIAITSQEKDVQRIDEEQTRTTRRREVVEAELAQEREELGRLEQQIAEARSAQGRLEGDRREAEAALEAAQQKLAEQERVLREAVARLEEVKVEAAAARERAEAVSAQLARLQSEVAEVATRRDAKEEQVRAEQRERERLEAEYAEQGRVLEQLLSEREAAERQAARAREIFESGEAMLAELEGKLGAERAGVDELSEALSRQNLILREAEIKLEQVNGEMRERYELELSEHVASLGEAERERLSMEELRADLHEEAEKQRRRLKAVGSVDLESIKEYDQVVEREKFLQTQHDDLAGSVADLERAIAKINKTTRERFKETFDAVNEKFHEVFPKLFLGGKGRLELTDPANLLESGVEIIVQPPGKKLGNMRMLSGGEQTLAAVALLLAIFLIRPAPFVVLDEVDAALDDANVGRYNGVIRELTQFSQVILITHNKQTMEMADTLVGITMEEAGVSKLVSVKLD